jgi:hypothetical protein
MNRIHDRPRVLVHVADAVQMAHRMLDSHRGATRRDPGMQLRTQDAMIGANRLASVRCSLRRIVGHGDVGFDEKYRSEEFPAVVLCRTPGSLG